MSNYKRVATRKQAQIETTLHAQDPSNFPEKLKKKLEEELEVKLERDESKNNKNNLKITNCN